MNCINIHRWIPQSQPNEPQMGFGFIILNNNNTSETFNGRTTNYPLSTRAELMANLTALITIPSKSTVNIITDSQAAIENLTGKSNKKIQNQILRNAIINTIEETQLTVTYIKIKGHSNNPYNDKADLLAKEGTKSTNHILPNPDAK